MLIGELVRWIIPACQVWFKTIFLLNSNNLSNIKVHFRNPLSVCEVCGCSVYELKLFSRDDILALELDYSVILYTQYVDRKLGPTFQGVTFNWIDDKSCEIIQERLVMMFWQYFDYLTSDPDEIDSILRDKNWICISKDLLCPMDGFSNVQK